VKLESFY